MYYDLVINRRQGKQIVHERQIYIGKLEGLDARQRELLVGRMETLLMNRYGVCAEAVAVERLAVELVGKLHSRRKGQSHARQRLAVKGGTLGDTTEERIVLKSFRPIRMREVGGEWLCRQAIRALGIRSFLTTGQGWEEEHADLLLLNLVGRLLHPSSERKTALWLNERPGAPDLLDSPLKIHDDGLHRVTKQLLQSHYALEEHLYMRLDEELGFGGQHMLYDLTNTCFEGRMLGSSLAKFGRSKEQRSDCRLVSIGLLTNEWGFIRRSDFHAGNIEQAALRGVGYMCAVREGFGQPPGTQAKRRCAAAHRAAQGTQPAHRQSFRHPI